jgi:signal transduction histidine kinase/ligand-binding sensor domain-containing protein/DNA-binding response OmpR family regulator
MYKFNIEINSKTVKFSLCFKGLAYRLPAMMNHISRHEKGFLPGVVPVRVISSLLFVINILYSAECTADGKTNIQSFDYYSQEDGLPNNQVQCIFQDRKGWIWLGTSQGLSRFDGYRFVNFLNDPEDTTSLAGRLVRVIFETSDGRLLVGTENGGLNVFDRDRESFIHPYRNSRGLGYADASVNAIAEDSGGNLYLGTDRSLLRIDASGNLSRITPSGGDRLTGDRGLFIRSILPDVMGNVWIGATEGLFVYHPAENTIEEITLPLHNMQSREVFEIVMDEEGLLWAGTYSGGLFIIDPATREMRHVDLAPPYDRTETIRAISRGNLGDFWIGTRGGLYVYSNSKGVTGFYRHDDRDSRSLANNSVLDIFHDSRGETWIGTRGGLNMLAKSKQVFTGFSALPDDNHYLNSSIIYAFWIDPKQRIWIGTEDGGINIYNPSAGTFEYLMAKAGDPNSISQNCIKAFLDDGKGNLWIGTFWGGIDVLDLKTGRITHYKHSSDDPASLSDDRVWALHMDKKGGIWVGTSAGIDRFEGSRRIFEHYTDIVRNKQVNWISTDSEDQIWLGTTDEVIIYDPVSENIVRHDEHSRSFLEDSSHNYWIATLDRGLARYSKSQGALKYIDENDGLANNQALCILEDKSGKLWISTSRGLSRYNPVTGQFRNFTGREGLRNDQFTYGAAYRADSGELLFGGISGFNMFNPAEIVDEDPHVPLLFTELRVFNKPVAISDGRDAILKKSISETTHLVLKYNQNVITLQFAALDFVQSEGSLYSYYLEGFDKDWSQPDYQRTATYTNLNPGDYIFRVRRVQTGNNSGDDELAMEITVLPPFWMTWWFRGLMVIVITALLYFLIRFLVTRELLRRELVQERTKAKNLHELDMLKLRLFTNISHEIRTPLTLILGPLEKMINDRVPPEEMHSYLDLVYRNTKNLDRLINQLLDFRKLETGALRLELTSEDMVGLISNVVASFEEYAREKQVTLRFQTLKKKLIAIFDPGKVETILNNLLSNALKYTEEGGSVTVNLSLVFAGDDEETLNDQPEKQYIEISVKDTGKGISESNITRIFTRFFRVDTEDETTGTGIGLALVKELVRLHKGNIYVISKPGRGSKFTIRLPYETEADRAEQDTAESNTATEQAGAEGAETRVPGPAERADARIMLIVEDNPDVRFFIRSHFDDFYDVYEARNGKEGWDLAVSLIPDVIISDILMPDVDGFEFCKRVKKDERTSHIPLLLLTALHSREHEIEGLSCGADDYLTKPFDISILQTKIENIMSMRKALKEKYTRELILKPSDVTVASPDERFLMKAMEVVEKNISNPDFDIERFADETGVSRMQLYRKFSALTNMTVKEFVRSIRLKRAAQLLLERKMTVSEIAFAVGFRDLSHFRKSFSREFGMSASDYVRRNGVV